MGAIKDFQLFLPFTCVLANETLAHTHTQYETESVKGKWIVRLRETVVGWPMIVKDIQRLIQ